MSNSDESEMERRQFLELAAKYGLMAGLGGVMMYPDPASAQKKGKGGTLIMVVTPEPPNLAPFISTANPVGVIATKCYDGLLEYNFNLEPIPSLAKSWDVSADGKTIIFKLQENVKFHDGKPFTSADVQFSIMDVLKKVHPRGPNTLSAVTAVETPDAHTAIFKLSEPAPYLMNALSGYESPMLPRHALSEGDIKASKHINAPLGTGPFKFVEWKRGEYIRLDKNPTYWRAGRPHLDRIVARFIGAAQTRSAAMQAGEVQYGGFSAIQFSDAEQMRKVKGIAVTTKGYEMIAPIVHLEINTTRKPFDDQRVRQAISYAIDRKFVIDNIWFGFGKPSTGPISSNFKTVGMYTDAVKRYDVPNRLELANKLLDEAGLKRGADGNRFSITHDLLPFGEDWKRFGEYVKQALGQVGIQVTLRYEDLPTWLRRVYTNYDFDLASDVSFSLSDPVIGVHRWYSSWSIRPGTVFTNSSRWHSPQTDALMKAATIEPDRAKRNAIYHEMQKAVVEAAPHVWVNELDWMTVYHTKFKDLVVSPLGIFTSFDQAYLE